jgi:hypothetical protein
MSVLSLKKICLQTLSRAAKDSNTAILGPQLFIPEIYTHFSRQIEIDADGGSECCYLTTERDIYFLYQVYICFTNYLGLTRDDIFAEAVEKHINKYGKGRTKIGIPSADYKYGFDGIFILTDLIYKYYNMSNISKYAKRLCLEVCGNNEIRGNICIFIYGIPPLLATLGLLFGRLIGPKYIKRRDIEVAIRASGRPFRIYRR